MNGRLALANSPGEYFSLFYYSRNIVEIVSCSIIRRKKGQEHVEVNERVPKIGVRNIPLTGIPLSPPVRNRVIF